MFNVKFDEENNIWNDCNTPAVFSPSISLGHILLKSLALNGSRIAQISDDTGDQFTFEELYLNTIRAAQNLQQLGYYEPKQVTTIMAGNVAHLAPIVFANLCLGCPINPLHTKLEKATVLHMLELTKPHLIFCEIQVYDLILEVITELKIDAKIFTFNGWKNDAIPVGILFAETGFEESFIPVEIDGINESAFIMSTSGSTGPSKGVCVSHASLISEIDATSSLYGDGIVFNATNLYWNTGLFTLLLGTIGGTTRIITAEDFSVEMQLKLIEKYKVTIVEDLSYNMVLMLKSDLLAKADLSSVKHFFAGGFKVPYSITQEFNSYLPNGSVNTGYGLTEVRYNVSVDFPHFSGKDSVGRLVSGCTIKIIDEQGKRCGVGQIGEICIKSRYKFLGYYKNTELTQEAIDGEGFFLTGDIGHIDASGYLCITDRKKNVIVYFDDWVFPSEIEDVLLKSADIESVCVVGIPFDAVIEVPAAVVVRAAGSKITEEEISKIVEGIYKMTVTQSILYYSKSGQMVFSIPSDNLIDNCKLRGGVHFRDFIPTTLTGKPLRRAVKEIATKCYQMKQKT